ncbi:coiled-coil domain-containing protein 150 [Cuculus canorus]|uniref:coiled-coil domain-containing protein 150 n=1 Tax=Cuculus canorus TaxID=55661 RepID=UPI0023AB4CDC|nr:coiled-coil domain-containing protein 150 [Cuculus canorus]
MGPPHPCATGGSKGATRGGTRVGVPAEREAMARPPIVPTNIAATAPEVFTVLQLRMRVVEEETSALVRELEAFGVDGQSLKHFPSKTSETSASHTAISPVQARVAFVGENTLWKNCETLVNRMCRLESVVETLKSNIFQLQTENELNPKHAAQLEQRLNALHEEHLQEMKIVQQEAMKLHQHLSDMKEAEEKAKQEVQRLTTALEMTTASKMHAVIAAEELRNTNQKINCRLQEVTEQLSQEISLRESLEESQATVMGQIQDMETTVEAERKRVQILQQDCQELCEDVQLARVRLQEEEERTAQLEQQCIQLKAELDSRNCIISQLDEAAKNAQLSFNQENQQLQSTITALRETADKVQVLNDHLSQQCSELSTTLQSVALEYAKLISDQTMLKAEQEKMRKLQEQDSLRSAAHANILRELQSVQHERTQLQRALEALHTEHGKYTQKASLAEEAATAQRQLLECTVARLQGELETALQEKERLLAEKEDLQKELEMVSMKFTLQTLEEENKRLLDCLAALAHEQYAQQQVQKVLSELTDSKKKLACDKGKLQVEPLCKALESARTDKKLFLHLAEVLQINNTLQSKLIQTQYELKSKETELQQMMVWREQLMEKTKAEEKMYAERLESLKKSFQTEQEASRKADCQESAESQDILNFVSKLKSIQGEIPVMLKNQHEVQVQNRQLETQLEAERRQRQKLENECQEKKQVLPTHTSLDSKQGTDPTPPAHQQESLRELGRK